MSKKQIKMTPKIAQAQLDVRAARGAHNKNLTLLIESIEATTHMNLADEINQATIKGFSQRCEESAKKLADANLELFMAEIDSVLAP